MTLPISRNTTYVADSTPAIQAADLNDMQDLLLDLTRAISGPDFHMEDEFDRAAVTSVWWDTITGAPTISTDYAAYGVYAATLAAGVGNNYNVQHGAGSLPFRTNDLHFSARARITARSGTGYAILYPCGGELEFVANSSGNWVAQVSGVQTDTGVAYSSTYQRFDIIRKSGIAYFFIDGTLVHSAVHTVDMTTTTMGWGCNGGTGGATMKLDSWKLRFKKV